MLDAVAAVSGAWKYPKKPWLFCGDKFLEYTTDYVDLDSKPVFSFTDRLKKALTVRDCEFIAGTGC